MGLFSDNIPPIKSLVSLSGRGGNATAAGASSSSAAAGGSNNNNNSSKPSPAGSSPASSVPVTRCDKTSLGGMSDNQKSLSASTSRCAGGGSSSMQQLSTSWEFIKLEPRPIHDLKTDDEKDEPQDVAPPRFIKISDDGKICLGPPKPCDTRRDKEVLEARIVELEEALKRLQEKVNNSQSGSPTLEKDLKEQLESMNRAMKSKERKAMQACRDHKVLQARFTRQETLLQIMQQENKTLQQRIRQYEHCLDDVMRKVVDAIVAEDSLREEVAMLKSRVRDLEAQNAALNASPAKGKDEGYCTMSSGQPQPSNGHLEDLPEEPEQWFMSAEPCSAEMEDWSMSQEELGVIALDEDSNEHDWVWNSSGYLNSTMIDSQSEGISQLLQETIVYSEDEEIACIDFTKDFYKLVSIPSGSTRSLYSHMEAETDDEDDTPSECDRLRANGGISPTPSEAGQAQVTSCSSSESDGQSRILNQVVDSKQDHTVNKTILREEIEASTAPLDNNSSWRRSSGWKRIASQSKKEIKPETHKQTPSRPRESKIPPPVPIRRSYAS